MKNGDTPHFSQRYIVCYGIECHIYEHRLTQLFELILDRIED